jgi:hypothetical protein
MGLFSRKSPTFEVWLPVVDELRTFEGILTRPEPIVENEKGHTLLDIAFEACFDEKTITDVIPCNLQRGSPFFS